VGCRLVTGTTDAVSRSCPKPAMCDNCNSATFVLYGTSATSSATTVYALLVPPARVPPSRHIHTSPLPPSHCRLRLCTRVHCHSALHSDLRTVLASPPSPLSHTRRRSLLPFNQPPPSRWHHFTLSSSARRAHQQSLSTTTALHVRSEQATGLRGSRLWTADGVRWACSSRCDGGAERHGVRL